MTDDRSDAVDEDSEAVGGSADARFGRNEDRHPDRRHPCDRRSQQKSSKRSHPHGINTLRDLGTDRKSSASNDVKVLNTVQATPFWHSGRESAARQLPADIGPR